MNRTEYLTCPVDDVEEHLGVILQPHGKVVQLLGLPDEGAPHVDPLVDGDARLLLGLGLVWMPNEERGVRVSQSLCKCNRRRNIYLIFCDGKRKSLQRKRASAKNLRQRSVLKVTRGKAAGAPFIVFIRLK